ncbi:MAG: flavodoxin family protein [Spirochaetota bacterium]
MILVVYYSLTGRTEKVAEEIASKLKSNVEKIIDKKKRKGLLGFIFAGRDAFRERLTEIDRPLKDPSNYDLVILGTPIWASNITPALRTYLNMYKGGFKKLALFTTSGGKDYEKVSSKIAEITGIKPMSYAGFSKKELLQKNKNTFEEKLSAFLKELK